MSAASRDPSGGGCQPVETGEEPRFWRSVGGWRSVFGRVVERGFSIEWHDFPLGRPFEWHPSFHPGVVELCFNFEGRGEVQVGNGTPVRVGEGCYTCYARRDCPVLRAVREPAERHWFVTLEIRPDFLARRIDLPKGARGVLRDAMDSGGDGQSFAAGSRPMAPRLRDLVLSLDRPPVLAAARPLWFEGKVLEILAETLFEEEGRELFCQAQNRTRRERVTRVQSILEERMEEPPSLEELGRMVGCSPYYLSRTFSSETGMTIPQYLRRVRVDRAARLLSSGEANVTEAALAVGYTSLSHFSQAFCHEKGCCPALYTRGGGTDPAVS